jgi:anti-sigma factor RsiW
LSVSHEADQELLSAYLDGELTAEEQARVERLLAENAAYRQLHDELRALRTNFEVLPRYALSKDLSGQVLRRAEHGWRPWLWPAVAAAAALYMVIFNPERAPRKMAQVPRDPANIAMRAPASDQPAERQGKHAAKNAGAEAAGG